MARKLQVEHGVATSSLASETEFRERIVTLLPNLMTMARHMSNSADLQMDPEDLVQATIHRALLRFRQWRQDGDLAGWLFVIMRSVGQNEIRSKLRRIGRETNAAQMTPTVIDIERHLHRRLLVGAIDRLCTDLSANEVWLLGMIYGQGYTGEELATQLDTSLGTIYGRLARARAKIARRLMETDRSQ